MGDLLDQTLSFQFDQSTTSDGTVDAQAIDQDTNGDELVGGDFLQHLVVGGLVHDDSVVTLFLGLSLRPLLLLCLSTRNSLRSGSLINGLGEKSEERRERERELKTKKRQ